ncbi:MAG: serine/threonine-protein kinase [Candidatus Melainabacteria bacterium]|nr:serine/threonine-protein kinase [Candidatus Melainabacteria bacterium]
MARSKAAVIVTLSIAMAAGMALLILGQEHVLSGFLMILLAGIAVSSIVAFLNVMQVFAPTHVELNEKGIRYHWLTLLFQAKTPLVSWDRISHVTTVNKNVLKQNETMLEFNAIARGISFKNRIGYALLAPRLTWGWFTSDRAALRLEVDAIASSDDRRRLQLALKKFLPSYRIEPKVADDLDMYVRFETHTDLWLDKFSDDSKRSRETRLEENALLSNNAYQVVRPIGSGGQALVYLAQMLKPLPGEDSQPHDTMIDMSDMAIAIPDQSDANSPAPQVVLKEFVLPTQAGTNIRRRVLENIQKEAALWRKLRHPNIARLLDFFVEDQRAYLVLEHVDGITLKDLVTEFGAFSEADVITLSIQMCDILGYLHRRQPPVIHRDFTPDNLIMNQKGIVKLIDFNVAQQLEAQTTKTVVGKHSYIPPEQFRGKSVPQSDIYALGATLAFLLTGQDPEPITPARPRESNSDVSQELDDIVAKCTNLGLSTRYQDCQELKTDLVALVKSHTQDTTNGLSGF